METKEKTKEYIEHLTGKRFPNLCRLSVAELKEIKQMADDQDVFWNRGIRDQPEMVGPVGCGPMCEHGHNSLTCPECMDEQL